MSFVTGKYSFIKTWFLKSNSLKLRFDIKLKSESLFVIIYISHPNALAQQEIHCQNYLSNFLFQQLQERH